MSDQAKQEWKPISQGGKDSEPHDICFNGKDCIELGVKREFAQAICDLHTAALAAEREAASRKATQSKEGNWTAKDGVIYLHLDDGGIVGWPMRYMHHAIEIVEALQAQLAAERDKRSYSRLHVDLAEAKSEIEKLRSQLAEERDKWKRIWLESDNREAANLREQLAAEREKCKLWESRYYETNEALEKTQEELAAKREKVQTLVDALKQLREQLAVERERCEEPRCDFVSHLQLQKQLAALVEALKEIQKINIKENDAHEVADRMGKIADAALAKVSK